MNGFKLIYKGDKNCKNKSQISTYRILSKGRRKAYEQENNTGNSLYVIDLNNDIFKSVLLQNSTIV